MDGKQVQSIPENNYVSGPSLVHLSQYCQAAVLQDPRQGSSLALIGNAARNQSWNLLHVLYV